MCRDRNENPDYFETIECIKCKSKSNLRMHRYSDVIMCASCVKELVDKLKNEDEDNEEHDDYRDKTYSELLNERNKK